MLKTATTIIRESVQLYHANFKLFLKYIGLLAIPSLVLYAISIALKSRINLGNPSVGPGVSVPLFVGSIILAIVVSIISLWMTIAFIRAIAARLQDQPTNAPTHELVLAKPTILPVIVIFILYRLVVMGGMLLLIVPGILFLFRYAFAQYSVILDGKTGGAALKHSRSLVKGQWWGVVWRLVVPVLVFGLVTLATQLIITTPIGMALKLASDSTVVLPLFAGLMSLAITLVLLPLTIIAPIILYVDLKKKQMGGTAATVAAN